MIVSKIHIFVNLLKQFKQASLIITKILKAQN